MGTNSGVTEVGSSIDGFVARIVDWDSLQIEPIPEEQIVAAVSFMDEAMYEFVGLREEDERAEKARIAAEKERENDASAGVDDLDGADLAVHDLIPGEDAVDYDRENPPMKVGSTYATMSEFRGAVRQHAIKEKVKEGGKEEAEVTEITQSQKIIRHVVNLKNHTCTCREWQVSRKPCQYALALIITYRNPKMEYYLDPYYSVYHFRLAYGGVIRPLTDKSQWAKVDIGFKLRPPLAKRHVGRQKE